MSHAYHKFFISTSYVILFYGDEGMSQPLVFFSECLFSASSARVYALTPPRCCFACKPKCFLYFFGITIKHIYPEIPIP